MDNRTMYSRPSSLQRGATMIVSCALAILLLVPADPALGGNASPNVYGQTIGNWGQAWWQWALSFPTAVNPIVQDGAVDCSAGQSGKVWYLAGTFGSSAERTCSVMQGKALFFPLLNGIFWTPEDCPDELSCRVGVSTFLPDVITSWTCTVDGTPCIFFTQVVRAQSDARPLDLPPGSIAVTDFGYAPGVRELSISDGYWVMLDPLPPGSHTIRFTAAAPGFSLDVTYHLTVGH